MGIIRTNNPIWAVPGRLPCENGLFVQSVLMNFRGPGQMSHGVKALEKALHL